MVGEINILKKPVKQTSFFKKDQLFYSNKGQNEKKIVKQLLNNKNQILTDTLRIHCSIEGKKMKI